MAVRFRFCQSRLGFSLNDLTMVPPIPGVGISVEGSLLWRFCSPAGILSVGERSPYAMLVPSPFLVPHLVCDCIIGMLGILRNRPRRGAPVFNVDRLSRSGVFESLCLSNIDEPSSDPLVMFSFGDDSTSFKSKRSRILRCFVLLVPFQVNIWRKELE